MRESILQFGTGKFLRAFLDLFLQQQHQAGHDAGGAVALQSTASDRLAALHRQGGRYRVAIRGLENGRAVDHLETVASLRRGLSIAAQWPEIVELAQDAGLQAVVTNTTEAGLRLEAADAVRPAQGPPQSFPARLLALLVARHAAGLPGLAILPCELVEANADRLRQLVAEQAARWQLADDVCQWLLDGCTWHNTLVDRIVSAPAAADPRSAADPLYCVAEPFAFWGIEGAPALPGLLSHPAVRQVVDLRPYALRKVRILNAAHTALVARALPRGMVTVRQALADAEISAWLRELLFEEIVPTLEGRTDDPAGFAEIVLQRFANPFLEHRLADIALHHAMKLQTRLAPTCEEFRVRFGRSPKRLTEVLDGPR